MSATPRPLRYDLVHDFGRFLVELGLVTRTQLGEAEAEWIASHDQSARVTLTGILVRRGWVSPDQVADVRRSVITFVPLPDPLDPRTFALPPACTLLSVILEMAVHSAAAALRFRPGAEEVEISHCIDGEWYEMTPLLHSIFRDVRGLVEAAARDGRLRVRAQGKDVDVLVRPFDPGGAEWRLEFEYPGAG